MDVTQTNLMSRPGPGFLALTLLCPVGIILLPVLKAPAAIALPVGTILILAVVIAGGLAGDALRGSPIRGAFGEDSPTVLSGVNLRLASFVVRHWRAIVAVMATCYVPLSITAIREDERAADAAEIRRQETAERLAEAWSAFCGPLISFGAQCGPIVARHEAVPAACHDLSVKLIQAYAQVSWYLPAYVFDVRTRACKDAAAGVALAKRACTSLDTAGDLVRSSGETFRKVVNGLAAYDRSPSGAKSGDLGSAMKAFYDSSRKLGCALNFAGLAAAPPHFWKKDPPVLGGTSPYCESYLNTTQPAESAPLQFDEWFRPSP